MKQKIVFICIVSIVCYNFCVSQSKNTYTLQECIDIAINNNLELKRTTVRAKTSKTNYKQARTNLLPDINMNYNLGVNYGRSIDPFTNDFIDQRLAFSNAGLQMNTIIFNGFRLMNRIRQNKLSLQAAEMEIEENKQSLLLDVTLSYIQILNNRDLLELSASRLETTKKQLERLEVLYKEESGNPVDYTDMKGQLAIDQSGVVTAENMLKDSMMNLFQILNLETDEAMELEQIEEFVEVKEYVLSANDIFDQALAKLAVFKRRQLRVDAAKTAVKVARANYYPEVAVFGQVNTNYSSAARTFLETGTAIEETGDFVTINTQGIPVFTERTLREKQKIRYEEQFRNNVSSAIGVSVSIPIFNKFEAKNTVALQKIQMEEFVIELENTKLAFRTAVEQAYLRMESAQERFYIITNQVIAYEESFRINEIRFNNGVSNIVGYLTSKNNLDSARVNLSNIKHEYLLRRKILDYYRGLY